MVSGPTIIERCGLEPEQLATPRFKYETFSGMMNNIQFKGVEIIKDGVRIVYRSNTSRKARLFPRMWAGTRIAGDYQRQINLVHRNGTE
jgi:hypothetical protein